MSRYDSTGSLHKKRPVNLFTLVCAGLFMCAGVFGTRLPAFADSFSHLPTIDLYPTASWATGNDEYGSPGGPDPTNNYGFLNPAFAGNCPGCAAGGTRPGKLDLNAVLSIPVVRGLALQYEHDRAAGIDTTIGRVTGQTPVNGHYVATNQYLYAATSNDIVDTFRLSYTGIKGVGVTAGTFYRFRHDNQATADPGTPQNPNLQPQDWHEQFVNVSYTAPAITALNGLTVGVDVDGEYNKHHVSGNPSISPYAPANAGSGLNYAALSGYSDTDGKARYGLNYGFNANLPISRGAALFGSWSKGAFDFFDNNPVPFYYTIIDVGLFKKFNQTLSLTGDLNNLTQYNLGNVPFISPNTIHRIYFALALDIHISPSGHGY